MVVLRFDAPAVQRGNARDDKAVFFLFDLSAERAQEIRRALEAVGLLEPQPVGVFDSRLPLCDRRDDAQHGDEVGDGCSVDRHAMQCAAPDRHGVSVLGDFRAEPAQNVYHAAVALRGLQIQPLDGHALFRQRTHAEEERRVRPVALDDRALRQMTSLLTGNRPHRPHFGDGQLGKLKCILRHGDVSRGFQRAGHHKKAVSDQQRQRHEKARNILRGHIACDRIVSPDQLSTAIQQVAVLAERHAMLF